MFKRAYKFVPAIDIYHNIACVLTVCFSYPGPTVQLLKNSGMILYAQQFIAMFLKRVLHTLRNKLVTVTQLVIPLFFTVMGIVVLKTLPSVTDSPMLLLTVEKFGFNYIPFASAFPGGSEMAKDYARQFLNMTNVHVTDVNHQPGYENNTDLIKYLYVKGRESIGTYNLRYMVAAAFNNSNPQYKATATAFFNNQAYHSIAISLAAMFNGLLQYFTNSLEYSIETTNHPLPRLTANKVSPK